jgi:hypothetical protein
MGMFLAGFALAAVALWFFFDSVRVGTGGYGLFTGWLHGGGTASMGIVFVPFLLGVLLLAYESRWWWAWALMWAGLGIIAVEILSRVRFFFSLKASYLLLMMALFAVGAGLMIRSYRPGRRGD